MNTRIDLDDGSSIVLFDVLGKRNALRDEHHELNVQRLDSGGGMMWRIAAGPPIFEGSPFTNVWLEASGKLMAQRWDGVEYEVDIETGSARPIRFLK